MAEPKVEPKVEPAATEPKVEPAATEPKAEPAATEPKAEPKVEPKAEPASNDISNLTREIENLRKQNQELAKESKESKEIKEKLLKVSSELNDIKKEQMTEQERKDTERLEAIERAETAERRSAELLVEKLKLEVLIDNSVSPRLLKYVQGNNKEEILASVGELKSEMSLEIESQVTKLVAQKEEELIQQNTSVAGGGNPARTPGEPKKFTIEQISQMSLEDYKANKQDIDAAIERGDYL